MTKKDIPSKWRGETKAVKAIQLAFDVGAKIQKQIRIEALQADLNPSDRIRQILGLDVTPKPVRPRLSISLTEEDFSVLARNFNVPTSDRVAIKQLSAQLLIDHANEHE